MMLQSKPLALPCRVTICPPAHSAFCALPSRVVNKPSIKALVRADAAACLPPSSPLENFLKAGVLAAFVAGSIFVAPGSALARGRREAPAPAPQAVAVVEAAPAAPVAAPQAPERKDQVATVVGVAFAVLVLLAILRTASSQPPAAPSEPHDLQPAGAAAERLEESIAQVVEAAAPAPTQESPAAPAAAPVPAPKLDTAFAVRVSPSGMMGASMAAPQASAAPPLAVYRLPVAPASSAAAPAAVAAAAVAAAPAAGVVVQADATGSIVFKFDASTDDDDYLPDTFTRSVPASSVAAVAPAPLPASAVSAPASSNDAIVYKYDDSTDDDDYLPDTYTVKANPAGYSSPVTQAPSAAAAAPVVGVVAQTDNAGAILFRFDVSTDDDDFLPDTYTRTVAAGSVAPTTAEVPPTPSATAVVGQTYAGVTVPVEASNAIVYRYEDSTDDDDYLPDSFTVAAVNPVGTGTPSKGSAVKAAASAPPKVPVATASAETAPEPASSKLPGTPGRGSAVKAAASVPAKPAATPESAAEEVAPAKPVAAGTPSKGSAVKTAAAAAQPKPDPTASAPQAPSPTPGPSSPGTPGRGSAVRSAAAQKDSSPSSPASGSAASAPPSAPAPAAPPSAALASSAAAPATKRVSSSIIAPAAVGSDYLMFNFAEGEANYTPLPASLLLQTVLPPADAFRPAPLAAPPPVIPSKTLSEQQQQQRDRNLMAAAAATKSGAKIAALSVEAIPDNVLEARDWIDAWRRRHEAPDTPAPVSGSADVGPSPDMAIVADVPINVAEARAWIASWKLQQTEQVVAAALPAPAPSPAPEAISPAVQADTTPSNVAEARAWIASWKVQHVEQAAAAPAPVSAPAPAFSSPAVLASVETPPANVLDARAWISAWRQGVSAAAPVAAAAAVEAVEPAAAVVAEVASPATPEPAYAPAAVRSSSSKLSREDLADPGIPIKLVAACVLTVADAFSFLWEDTQHSK